MVPIYHPDIPARWATALCWYYVVPTLDRDPGRAGRRMASDVVDIHGLGDWRLPDLSSVLTKYSDRWLLGPTLWATRSDTGGLVPVVAHRREPLPEVTAPSAPVVGVLAARDAAIRRQLGACWRFRGRDSMRHHFPPVPHVWQLGCSAKEVLCLHQHPTVDHAVLHYVFDLL